MNLYFLLEGRRTEYQVYPAWLSYLLPELKRIYDPHKATHNNYFMISGMGYPSLLNYLVTSAEEVNEAGNYDYLVICVDSEEFTVKQRLFEILDFVRENKIKINAKFKVLIQNKCFETWFLGNREMMPDSTNNQVLKEFTKYYDVSKRDPEKMDKYKHFSTAAAFHYEYLKQMLKENNFNYSKKNTDLVEKRSYLNDLIKRNEETGDIFSFKYFLDFCLKLKSEMK